MASREIVKESPEHSAVIVLSIAGAIFYVLWGCLHVWSAKAVFQLAAALPPGIVRGRVFQDAWNLLFFGITVITIAVTLNVRNSTWGYWINLWILALADTGLIFFALIPGYMPLWPGLAGPILWILGWLLTTLAYFRSRRGRAVISAH